MPRSMRGNNDIVMGAPHARTQALRIAAHRTAALKLKHWVVRAPAAKRVTGRRQLSTEHA